MKKIAVATLLGGAVLGSLLGAGAAQASGGDGDTMYRIGVEIQPGDYKYTVVGNGMGSWQLCSDAACDGSGLIDIETIDGMGHTGYLTVPAGAKFLKTNDLVFTPM